MSTIAEEARTGHDHHGHDHGGHCEERVTIIVNNKEVFAHRGHLTVQTIKQLAQAPLTDELDQLVGSKILPLPDDGKVHIEGCEIFIHHPKDGGSS
jgi:hypothetical protein